MSGRGYHLDGLSIKDLCKPLSATVLPRSAIIAMYGDLEMTPGKAHGVQRTNALMALKRLTRRAAKK